MTELTNHLTYIIAGVVGCVVLTQLFFTLYLFKALRDSNRERSKLHTDMFGLLRKIEGLTSSKREQMLKHYDAILEDLTHRLPPAIAAQAGEVIFDTESKILSRLAELEPNLKEDAQGMEKMDQLIKSMENLETTIVRLTADAVQNIFTESRKSLFEENEKISSLANSVVTQRVTTTSRSDAPYS